MIGSGMREDAPAGAATRRSLIYRNPHLYRLVMLLLYRRGYRARQAALAELIAPGSSVVEACCGVGTLYSDHLRKVGVRYVGLDLSPEFVSALERRGIDARLWDMHAETQLPGADYVVMQASLYHFLPEPQPIVDRMLAAAGREVLIAEPIRNLTTDHPRLRRAFAALSDAGAGPEHLRFDEGSLDSLFEGYRDRILRVARIAGGREKLYVLRGEGEAGAPSG